MSRLKIMMWSLTSLLFCLHGRAEVFNCRVVTGKITTNMTIQSEWVDGIQKYPFVNIKNDATAFEERVNLRTIVKRKGLISDLSYNDLVGSKSVEVNLKQIDNGYKFSGSAKIYPGMLSEKKIDNFECVLDGSIEPWMLFDPPLPNCDKTKEVLAQELIKAAQYGTLDQMDNALTCGADPNYKDQTGCTSLLFVTNLSCGYKSDGSVKNPSDPQAPQSPPSGGRSQMVATGMANMLIDKGANYQARDPITKETVLHNAVKNSLHDVTWNLITVGAKIDAKNIDGDTPLMYAAATGSILNVKYVLHGDPDLAIKNNQGKSAYDIAKERGNDQLLELLQPADIKAEVKGQEDGTCAPTMIHVEAGKSVELALTASSKMFIFTAPDFQLELMAMANQTVKKMFKPAQKGNFPFKCGVHGSPDDKMTRGTIMVM